MKYDNKLAQIWSLKAKLEEMREMGAAPKDIEKLEDDIVSLQTDNLPLWDDD